MVHCVCPVGAEGLFRTRGGREATTSGLSGDYVAARRRYGLMMLINPTVKREDVPLQPRTSRSIWALQSILILSTVQPAPISARAFSLASSTDSPPTTTLQERGPPFCLTRIAY